VVNRIVSLSLVSILSLAIGSCGGPNPFASAPESKLKTALSPPLGAPLADEVAAAWKPALDDMAKLEAAGSARDFAAYHQAMVSLRATYGKGVDETIRILDASTDQGWRRRLLADAVGGTPGGAESKSLEDCFPALSEESDETKSWFRGQMIEHPRESGEVARVIVGLHYDSARLSMYFVTAMSAEGAKSIGEVYEGFTNPDSPQAPAK
jgi:hypothetical protein